MNISAHLCPEVQNPISQKTNVLSQLLFENISIIIKTQSQKNWPIANGIRLHFRNILEINSAVYDC